MVSREVNSLILQSHKSLHVNTIVGIEQLVTRIHVNTIVGTAACYENTRKYDSRYSSLLREMFSPVPVMPKDEGCG